MEMLKKLVVPAVWLGIASLIIGIIDHLGPKVIAGLTGGGFLGVAQACFLFAIAVSVVTRTLNPSNKIVLPAMSSGDCWRRKRSSRASSPHEDRATAMRWRRSS